MLTAGDFMSPGDCPLASYAGAVLLRQLYAKL